MRPTALAAGPLVPTVDSQRPLAPCHDASTGTKLSQHAPPAAHPVQNSPSTQPSRAIPVQNSPSTPEIPLFGAFCASRENFVPLPPPPSRAGRIFYRIRNHLRYKTLPTRAPGGRYRYKTLPARAPVGPTGTKLSQHARKRRFWPTFRTQGEFYTASTTNKPSREKKVTHRHPTAPHQRTLPQFRMQFDCMKFQQHPETLQFQRSHFKSRNTPRGIACEIIRSHSAGGRQQCQGGAHSITSIAGVKGVGGHGRATHSNKPRLIGGAAMPAGPSRTTSRRAEQSSPRGRFAGSHAAQQPGHTAERSLGSRKSGRPRRRPENKRGNRQATQAARNQAGQQAGHAGGRKTDRPPPTGTHSQSTRTARPRTRPVHAGRQATRVASPLGWPKTRRNNRHRNAGGAAASGSQAPSDAPTWRPRPSAQAGARHRRRPGRGPRPRR